MNPEGESKLVNVYGDKFAKARPRPQVAFQRMISTQEVTFVCAVCEKTVTQQRYPGRHPRYCSDPCEEEGRRKKTRERVKKQRARQRMMQKQETEQLPQEKM
jgi:hypothetical protein